MLTARALGLLVATARGSTAPVRVFRRTTRPLLCPVACAVTRYACTPCPGTTYSIMHSFSGVVVPARLSEATTTQQRKHMSLFQLTRLLIGALTAKVVSSVPSKNSHWRTVPSRDAEYTCNMAAHCKSAAHCRTTSVCNHLRIQTLRIAQVAAP